MLVEISTFRSHVFAAGYQCKEIQNGKEKTRAVVEKEELSFYKERMPFDEAPALHRSFADLEMTEEAVLSFANQWGLLGGDGEEGDIENPTEQQQGSSGYGDSLDDWYSAIKTMKNLEILWDMLSHGSEQELSPLFKIKGTPMEKGEFPEVTCKLFPDYTGPLYFSDRQWAVRCGHSSRGRIGPVAWMAFYELFQEYSPWLLDPQLGPSKSTGKPAMFFVPNNLSDVLWLMFAQEILGEKNLKQCSFCKRYFEVSKEEKDRRQRSDKKYCSPKCRAAAFRERRDLSPPPKGKK